MNREDTKKAIEVMQAYVDGEDIESRDQFIASDGWGQKATEPGWLFGHREYRIKPKAREFWVRATGGSLQDDVIYYQSCGEPTGIAKGTAFKVREVIDE